MLSQSNHIYKIDTIEKVHTKVNKNISMEDTKTHAFPKAITNRKETHVIYTVHQTSAQYKKEIGTNVLWGDM